MKKLSYSLFLGVAAAAAIVSAAVGATVVNGTLNLTLNGTLRVAGTGYTTVNCTAHAILIPSTDSAVTVGAAGLLSWLSTADQSANAHAGFDYSTTGSSVTGIKPVEGSTVGTVTAFTCVVHVPYRFTDSVGGQSILVLYDVTASDNGSVFPSSPPTYPGGHTRQVMQIAAPPSDGGTIGLSTTLKL